MIEELWASPSSSSFRALGSSRSSMVNLSSLSSTKDLKARFTAGSLSPGRLCFSWEQEDRHTVEYTRALTRPSRAFPSIPGTASQTAGLCSEPSLPVRPDPATAGGPAQQQPLRRSCPAPVCPRRDPGRQQKCSACPPGSAPLSAVRGRRVLGRTPA